jgi:hypothetical protein
MAESPEYYRVAERGEEERRQMELKQVHKVFDLWAGLKGAEFPVAEKGKAGGTENQ